MSTQLAGQANGFAQLNTSEDVVDLPFTGPGDIL